MFSKSYHTDFSFFLNWKSWMSGLLTGFHDHLISLLSYIRGINLLYFLFIVFHISWFSQDRKYILLIFLTSIKSVFNSVIISCQKKKVDFLTNLVLIQWLPLLTFHRYLASVCSLILCSNCSKESNDVSLNVFNTFIQRFLKLFHADCDCCRETLSTLKRKKMAFEN